MNIGLIIRKLRVSKKMSQEELANQLGVSPQSVSRWENGITYPDISLLSSIALLFNVSIDYLLCGEEEIINKQIDETIVEANKVLEDSNHTDYLRPLEIVRELLTKYPNNERLIIETLHRITAYAYEIESYDYSEAISLCEKILNISKNDWYREEAKTIMLDCYVKAGLIGKAIKVMDSIPVTLNPFQLRMRIFDKNSKEYQEANKKNTKYSLLELIRSIESELDNNIDKQSDEELLKKYIGILKIIEGVYGEEWNKQTSILFSLNHLYVMIIKECIKINNLDLALEYFEKLIDNDIEYEKQSGNSHFREKDRKLFETNKIFDCLRKTDKFKELINKL